MKFNLDYEIANITPADYNPRKIKDNSFEKLKESLLKFGVVKPVISNLDGTIVAGHQRTKAMKAVGITKVPIFILDKNVSLQDEIKFNLMHNSIETETSKTKITSQELVLNNYVTILPNQIEIIKKGSGSIIKEICKLLNKYGDFGSVIVDEQGNVIHNSDYAFCCKLLNKELVVYQMSNETAKEFIKYMNIDYGEYDYETLGIKPYGQTFCQMNRNGKNVHSSLYERLVLPNIDKQMRIVDFGAGKCFYAKSLKQKGYNTHFYEPFPRTKGTDKINISLVLNMINDLNKDIKTNGLYDVVVLDSVINSITSNDYEDFVLTTCNSLCSENGVFYMGTRNKEATNRINNSQSKDKTRYIEFLDKDNFSATFRKEIWTLQKFHTKDSLKELLLRYFDDIKVYSNNKIQLLAECRKPKNLNKEKYKKALNVEFNLEYPNGYKHNRHESLVSSILNYH